MMPTVGEDTRLLRAAQRAFEPLLGTFGFKVTGSVAAGRGSTVECANTCVVITVDADWYEGEIEIEVAALGAGGVPLKRVVDTSQARALSLTRLPRDIGVDALEGRLRQVAQLLTGQAPGLLSCDDDEVARLRTSA